MAVNPVPTMGAPLPIALLHAERNDVPIDKDPVVAAVDALVAACEDARAALRGAQTSYRRFSGLMERGVPVREAFAREAISTTRHDLSVRLDELERARHAARRVIIARGLDEGMSLGELARAWGFSRQLAARYAKEIAATPAAERPADRRRSGSG